ncbi:MAG: hypothetical protein LLG06_08885 [Desulfobacteraceae bacterium]|nr:hypothetical protein [Desulfobacteraceae bacterium]
MEILKNPPRVFGRFFDLLAPRRPARSIDRMEISPAGKVSLTMGNEVLGEWLWIKENQK